MSISSTACFTVLAFPAFQKAKQGGVLIHALEPLEDLATMARLRRVPRDAKPKMLTGGLLGSVRQSASLVQWATGLTSLDHGQHCKLQTMEAVQRRSKPLPKLAFERLSIGLCVS